MKSTKKHFTLETGECLITPDHPDAPFYEIYLRGKKVKELVVGLVIFKRDLVNEKTKRDKK